MSICFRLRMKVSFSPDIMPSGLLGSKHQLTHSLTRRSVFFLAFIQTVWRRLFGLFAQNIETFWLALAKWQPGTIYCTFCPLYWSKRLTLCRERMILCGLVTEKKIGNRVDCQRSEERSKTHKRLKEHFLIRRNRTKCARMLLFRLN